MEASNRKVVQKRLSVLGITNAEFARRLGVHRSYAHRFAWTRGVPIGWVRRVARALDMDPMELIPGGEDDVSQK